MDQISNKISVYIGAWLDPTTRRMVATILHGSGLYELKIGLATKKPAYNMVIDCFLPHSLTPEPAILLLYSVEGMNHWRNPSQNASPEEDELQTT